MVITPDFDELQSLLSNLRPHIGHVQARNSMTPADEFSTEGTKRVQVSRNWRGDDAEVGHAGTDSPADERAASAPRRRIQRMQ
jgi:hypothetical protein